MRPAYRPPVSRPPHDPYSYVLDRRAGWRTQPALSKDAAQTPDDGALALVPVPGSGALLNDPAGSFGGLTWPDNAVMLEDGDLILLDRTRGVLRRLDPCACAFRDWRCFPPIPGAGGIATGCGRLYLCDTSHRQVLVIDPRSGAVRGAWSSPAGGGLVPWQPLDAAVTSRNEVAVSDSANGGIHIFSPVGVRRRFFGGLGAVSSLAADGANRLYVRLAGSPDILVLDARTGQVLETPSRPEELDCRFPALPVRVLPGGGLDVASLCPPVPPPVVVDAAGNAADIDPWAPVYPKTGVWTSLALDSEISRCRWHRVILRGILPPFTTVAVFTLTDESDQPADLLALRPPEDWRLAGTWSAPAAPYGAAAPDAAEAETDFLLESPQGRYLWLKLVLTGPEASTPRICSLRIEFPRISLRRYLPSIVGAEPVAADFTDRWLAIFDRGFRDIEARIDREAALFDPLACPSAFLSWLASWVGITLERGWTEARRRVFLKYAPRLFSVRGTVHGMRSLLYLFLGLERFLDFTPRRAGCVPCEERLPAAWCPPRLILEHFKLRHWMFVGHDRLSDNARLWGERIVNRSALGGPGQHKTSDAQSGAQLGVTQLKTSQDPCGDPFYVYAHKLSIFVPASCVRNPTLARALDRLVALEKPAHVEARVIPVEPRFRIGVQAMLGLDAVIGSRTSPVQLDAPGFGHGTVLAGAPGHRPRFRVGEARIGGKTILSTESTV